MEKDKLVIIGGDAAGMGAAAKIRREQPERVIVVFERGNHTSYAACGIPYYVAGMVSSWENLVARTPEEFREKHNIDVRIRHEVIAIDSEKKFVKIRNLDSGETFTESWDQLLIATGASPIVPEIDGSDAEGVFALSTLQSGIDVFSWMEKHPVKKAVVAGAGYVGVEMAEALLERGIETTLIDMAPQVMSSMDKDMAGLVEDYMKEQGVKVLLSEELIRLEKDADGKVKSVFTQNHQLDADLVIMGIGIRPNTEMPAQAGIETGERDAILVNQRLETSIPGIWAAGDCATSWHLLKKRQVFAPLGTVANKHALVAGINISGGDAVFPGVLGTAITRFKELEVARTGLSEKEAEDEGIAVIINTIESPALSAYFPGSEKMAVKLIAEKESKRIIGCQIVGKKASGKRIDTIAMAIVSGMTAQQLVDADLSYAPPFSPVWDPVQTAARTIL